MVFSSITFLVYFLPIVLLLYHLSPKPLKNGVLLLASIFFYSWGAPRFIFVILGTTFLDFFLVRMMDSSSGEPKRKLLLILSVSMNLGLLFYFKYCNFFIENINNLLALCNIHQIRGLEVILPIGISFYTFESLTYVVDVYRRVHKPLTDFWNYQLYIIFFPKLIAGPIVRYHEIADQITDRGATDNVDGKLLGFSRFVIGLSKKVFIANTMAEYADATFEAPVNELNFVRAWVGVLSYTFQIYFDFSGYSDMAIGLAKMFGFRIPENFDNPYTSQSITEFWRRWHITLGKWMKNYLYIPLGGNKSGRARTYLNLWIVFLASGFWHGASWTFIVWGAYHGTFLVLERLFLLKVLNRLGKFISVLFTFFIVASGWIIFRSDSLSQAWAIFRELFSPEQDLPFFYLSPTYIFYFSLAVFFSFFTLPETGRKIQHAVFASQTGLLSSFLHAVIACSLFILAVSSIAATSFNPFIYFRF